jgi:hypothetical protein
LLGPMSRAFSHMISFGSFVIWHFSYFFFFTE